MRIAVAAIMMLALPVIAAAQSSLPPIGLPLPPIGLPLPPIGLPLAPIGLAPPAVTPPRIDAPLVGGPRREQLRFGSRRGFRAVPTVVYFLPIYDWGIQQMPLAPQPRVSGVTMPYLPSAPAPEPALTTATPAVAPAPLAPYVAPPPSTYYFIPGCYMGNVPPTQVALPKTCDLSRLITRTP